MKASLLIAQLQALIAENGDLECGRVDSSYGCEVVDQVQKVEAYVPRKDQARLSYIHDDDNLAPFFFQLG